MVQQPAAFLPLRELNWRWVFGLFAVLFVCLFTYKYLAYVAHGNSISPLCILIEEGGGVAGAILLFPAFYWVATHFPVSLTTWWKYLPVHLIAVGVLSFLLTSIMALQRNILFPLAGLGAYDYGYMPVRYLMEFANHFLVYWEGVALIYLFHHVRFARERELNQARLEANLAEAQLQNLRLQLEPHFLFNTLNTISDAVYENPEIADEMIGRLSTLLRRLLGNNGVQESTLNEELELLSLYTRIMQARFEDRLEVSVACDPGLQNASTPQFLLQPLIENAIRYGVNPETLRIKIHLEARARDGQLEITIRDHGPGFHRSGSNRGLGLSNTAERLERLYGRSHRFYAGDASGGGAKVELAFPLVFANRAMQPVTPELVAS